MQVLSHVNEAEPPLKLRDLSETAHHRFFRGLPFSKQRIQLALKVYDRSAKTNRLAAHRFQPLAECAALRVTEFELVGKIDNVAGTGIMVELRYARKSHPLTLQILQDLLGAQGLDLPLIIARIQGESMARVIVS